MIVIARDFSKIDPFPWCRFIRSSTNWTSPPLISFSWFLSSLRRVTIWAKVVKFLVEKRVWPWPSNKPGWIAQNYGLLIYQLIIFKDVLYLFSDWNWFIIIRGNIFDRKATRFLNWLYSRLSSSLTSFQAWLYFKWHLSLKRERLGSVCSFHENWRQQRQVSSGVFEPFFYLVLEEAAPVYFTCHLNNFAASCPIIP